MKKAKRNIIIAAVLVLVCAAVYLNWSYNASDESEPVDAADDAMYLVCPRTVDSDVFKDDRAVSAKWLKACLEAKRLIPRNAFVLYKPFPRLLKDRVVCLTGFGYDDKLKMESLVM